MDRETLSTPVANSQFYTAAVTSISNILSSNSQSFAEKENVTTPPPPASLSNPNTPVFELTEEVRSLIIKKKYYSHISIFIKLTPKRPLRSEAEKEKRLSRTQSIVANNSASSKIDSVSVSGDSSNSRNSISKSIKFDHLTLVN
jgi:hypothetical protein